MEYSEELRERGWPTRLHCAYKWGSAIRGREGRHPRRPALNMKRALREATRLGNDTLRPCANSWRFAMVGLVDLTIS